ncbi:hypothetical protein [Cupriavidus sp. EM10]|uniref:hypothetical protein n=1 Tax=Cupriavidus sp. EM10 TaxID=2839983 RepID=UPI001CEC7C96|nr:hypothetical protein [Cupriavidus sp. EM10]
MIDQVIKIITPEQLKALRAHTGKERVAFEKGKHDQGTSLGGNFTLSCCPF